MSSSFEVNKTTRTCNCLQDQTLSLSFLSSASALKDDESISVAQIRACAAHQRTNFFRRDLMKKGEATWVLKREEAPRTGGNGREGTERCQEAAAAPGQQLRAAEQSGWDRVVRSRAANPSFATVQEETSEETGRVEMTGLSNRAGRDGSCCVLARLEGKKLPGWDARINKAEISWSEKPIH